METKDKTSLSVNIEKLDDRLCDPRFIQVKKDAQGKELVLFLGATGAGKSTCINYLLGAKLDKTKNKGRYCAIVASRQEALVNSQKLPVIGMDLYSSCTVYSEIFYDSVNDIAYCDTAGFMDTRRTEDELQICASLTMQLAIQSAHHIKAIMIVIDWGIFETTITSSLQTLMLILSQLLIVPSEVIDSIVFLINKTPKDTNLKDFEALVSDYKKTIQTDLKYLKSRPIACQDTAEEILLKNIHDIIDLLDIQIRQRPENVVLLDVFDEGNTRKTILTLLKQKNTIIPKEKFNFKEYNEKRKVFDSEIKIIVPLIKDKRQKLLSNNIEGSSVQGALQKQMKEEDLLQPFKNNVFENDSISAGETILDNTDTELGTKSVKTNPEIIDFSVNNSQKEDGEAIGNLLLNLVETAGPEESPKTTIQPSIEPKSHSDYEENDATSSNSEAIPYITPAKIIRTCANLSGAAIGLFGLFLLGTGIGALAHGTLAASIIQAVFNMALDDAMACAFIYGLSCLFLASTIFYVTRVIVDNPLHTTHSSNALEDVINDNGYGTFEQPTQIQKNSTASPRVQNASTRHQTTSSQNAPGVSITGKSQNF